MLHTTARQTGPVSTKVYNRIGAGRKRGHGSQEPGDAASSADLLAYRDCACAAGRCDGKCNVVCAEMGLCQYGRYDSRLSICKLLTLVYAPLMSNSEATVTPCEDEFKVRIGS